MAEIYPVLTSTSFKSKKPPVGKAYRDSGLLGSALANLYKDIDEAFVYIESSLSGRKAVRLASAGALGVYTRVGNVITQNTPAVETIDGSAPVVGDRILFMTGAASAVDVGIYVVSFVGASGAGNNQVLTRAPDFDTDAEITDGILVTVREGTANSDSLWMLTTKPAALNTNTVVFTKLSTGALTRLDAFCLANTGVVGAKVVLFEGDGTSTFSILGPDALAANRTVTFSDANHVFNQSVASGGSPTFDATNVTGLATAAVAAAGAVMDTELVSGQVTVANLTTSVTVALASFTPVFVDVKPIMATLSNATTNPCGLVSAVIAAPNLIVTVSADPGATGAIINLWQDQRV